MKICEQSHKAIALCIEKALEKYSAASSVTVTDIHLQPNLETGELLVFNDDDEILASMVVGEWVNANPENFYEDVEMILRKILNRMNHSAKLQSLSILKPFSFVLIDDEKETMAELMLIDDEETLFLNDELLKGLDEELDAFLKDLLEN